MNWNIQTKFNLNDMVYIAEPYYRFYAIKDPYAVIGIRIDITESKTRITYTVRNGEDVQALSEDFVFADYAECTKWCAEKNENFS